MGQLYKLMGEVLKGDSAVIQHVYDYIITHLLNRPYVPGLLRIMAFNFAQRKDWSSIYILGQRIIEQKDPFLENSQLAAFLNYLTELCIKYDKGYRTTSNCTVSFWEKD
jgi:hypothetical protein